MEKWTVALFLLVVLVQVPDVLSRSAGQAAVLAPIVATAEENPWTGFQEVHRGDGSAAQSDIQVEKRVHDFDDVLNEFRNAPSIKIYSQATPDKHAEKQLTHKEKVEGPTPEKHNSIPQRKAGTVKAQWRFFRKIGRGLKRIGRKMWRGIKRVGKKIWRGAKRIVRKAWRGIKRVGRKVWRGIKRVGRKVWRGVKRVGRKVWRGIKRVGRKVWQGVKRFGKKVWKGVKKIGKKVWRGVKSIAKKAWKGIKKAGKWAWKGIKKVGKLALKFAKSPIGQMLIKGGLSALGIPPMISGPLLGTVTGLLSGQSPRQAILGGLMNAIPGGAGKLLGKFGGRLLG